MQERVAEQFLVQHGVHIVERNFRSGRRGEIDLIGYDGDTLVFFEVKYRTSGAAGYPEEAVTPSKQKTICRVSDYYRMIHHVGDDRKVRFDVVAITELGAGGQYVRWIRNAFDYCDFTRQRVR